MATVFAVEEHKRMSKGVVYMTCRPTGTPSYGEFQMEEGFGLPDS